MCQAVASFRVPEIFRVVEAPSQMVDEVAVTVGIVGSEHGEETLKLQGKGLIVNADVLCESQLLTLLMAARNVAASPDVVAEHLYLKSSCSVPLLCTHIAFTPLVS